MYGLLEVLYDGKKMESFKELYINSDSSDQFSLRSHIANELKDCPRFIPSHGTDWILCTLCQYQKDEETTVRVFQSIIRYVNKPIDFGLLNKKIEMREMSDIADSCIVGLSLFKERFVYSYEHRASPSPEYYKQMGALAFDRIGYSKIAEEFDGWLSFLEKELTI